MGGKLKVLDLTLAKKTKLYFLHTSTPNFKKRMLKTSND